MFTILPEFENPYRYRITSGMEYMSDKNITILGICRNVGKDLYENIISIDHIRKYCKNLSYFIYENDSTDNTVYVLKNLKDIISNFQYQSENLQLHWFSHAHTKNLKSQERTSNLARHRNVCLDFAQQNYPDSDFTIIMDLDFNQFNLNGILNSFGWFAENYTDAMVGNSFEIKKIFADSIKESKWNYDCWAYRGTWWEDLQKYYNHYDHDPMMWFGLWQPPIGSPPIKVNSAFGGIGIYKSSILSTARYDGYDCEHVCLHKELYTKNNTFRLYLNPSQIMIF